MPATAALGTEERRTILRSAWSAQLRMDRARLLRDGPVSIHLVELSRPRLAWQLLTAGLAERGHELVLVVPRRPGEAQPPGWGADALGALANVVSRMGEVSAGQSTTLGAPIPTGGEPLASFALVRARAPSAITTPAGVLQPLHAVGLAADEARLIREWSPEAFVELLALSDPLLATDPDRASLLQSPRARSQIEQRVEREGSSLQAMEVSSSEIVGSTAPRTWRIPAEAIEVLVCLLKGRTGHQRPFTVIAASGTSVDVVPSDHSGLELTGEDRATLSLSLTAARQLRAHLRSRPGQYRADALPSLIIEVA